MAEPQIQFARTSDGVSIAYASVGQGRCVIILPSAPQSHAARQWQMFSGLHGGMAERFHAVWFDSRGSGLSDRTATDFSRAAMIRDLEAIVERVGEPAFALFATYDAVPVAVTYAAAHSERVSHLVLTDGRVKVTDYFEAAAISAEIALRDLDWTLYTETLARVLVGLEDAEFAGRYAEHVRACVEPEALRKAFANQMEPEFDVPDGMLETISCPTLVLHNRGNKFLPVVSGQRIASAIPNARFQIIDDMVYATVPAMIAEFMGLASLPAKAPSPAPSGTVAILFADIAGSTALTEAMGDAAFRKKARDLDGLLRAIIHESDGRPIEGKLLGDGVLAVFTSARQAIEAAVRCGKAGDDAGLPLHLGINAGDVLHETDPDGRANVYGGAVNIAARIAADSAPGEVLVSETVRSLARTSSGVRFEDRGERELKGVGEPVRVWSVRADD
jgi:class 3 adenylate cyclase/pimeloyl-ACP methyl ester carboxylesterase